MQLFVVTVVGVGLRTPTSRAILVLSAKLGAGPRRRTPASLALAHIVVTMKQVFFSIVALVLLLNCCNRIERKMNSGIEKVIAARESIRNEFNPTSKKVFEERTGLTLTSEQENLIERDTYFPHEGEYSQVFNVTSKQIETWTTGEPPWNSSDWLTGSLPSYLTDKFENGNTISENVIYALNELCCEDRDLRFHNGQALVLELDQHKVWYVNWDY